MGEYSVGQPVSRREDPRLLRGEGRFLQDIASLIEDGRVDLTALIRDR